MPHKGYVCDRDVVAQRAASIRATILARPIIPRFMKFVLPEPNSGCWLWTGSTNQNGYGKFSWRSRYSMATHVALEELAGKRRPLGAIALHKCDNPHCVNPDHLWWGTDKENSDDKIRKGRACWINLRQRRLTREQVIYIRTSGKAIRALAREIGIDRTCISAIIRGRTYREITA